MAAAADLIRKIDFFESLNPKVVGQIARVCVELDYPSGDHIVRLGDPGLGLFFILRGKVNVDIETNAVRTTVATLQPGDFFGELSLIDNKPRSAHVICVEDTACLVLTRDSFVTLANKYPEIGLQIASALAGRLRAANQKLGQATAIAGEQAFHAPAGASPSDGKSSLAALDVGQPGLSAGKEQVKNFLIDAFGFIYMVKAMTRFSAALIGCPVEVECLVPGPEVVHAIIDGVKVVVFPASANQVLRIAAYDDGEYSATIMHPDASAPSAHICYGLEGWVSRHQSMYLHIPPTAEPWMEEAAASSTHRTGSD